MVQIYNEIHGTNVRLQDGHTYFNLSNSSAFGENKDFISKSHKNVTRN